MQPGRADRRNLRQAAGQGDTARRCAPARRVEITGEERGVAQGTKHTGEIVDLRPLVVGPRPAEVERGDGDGLSAEIDGCYRKRTAAEAARCYVGFEGAA